MMSGTNIVINYMSLQNIWIRAERPEYSSRGNKNSSLVTASTWLCNPPNLLQKETAEFEASTSAPSSGEVGMRVDLSLSWYAA